MKKLSFLLTAIILSGGLQVAFAAEDAANTGSMGETKTPSAVTPTAMSAGEVKKIDKDAGKITIKHGALANLDMPPMTMVFKVEDPAMLDQVKPGDKIEFIAERSNGALVVIKMDKSQ